MGGWWLELIQGMVNDFMKTNPDIPDIKVEVQYERNQHQKNDRQWSYSSCGGSDKERPIF